MIKTFLKSVFVAGMMFVGLSASGDLLEISGDELFVPEKLGLVRVFHDEDGFKVLKDGELKIVQNCFVDKQVRNISDKKLSYFLGTLKDVEINGVRQTMQKIKISHEDICTIIDQGAEFTQLSEEQSESARELIESGSYLSINEMSNGEYCIHAKTRAPGGGFWGGLAGYLIGKTVVHVAGQGMIWGITGIVTIFCPPAGPVVLLGMQSALLPAIEAASNTVGLGTGVIGMVVTGPV